MVLCGPANLCLIFNLLTILSSKYRCFLRPLVQIIRFAYAPSSAHTKYITTSIYNNTKIRKLVSSLFFLGCVAECFTATCNFFKSNKECSVKIEARWKILIILNLLCNNMCMLLKIVTHVFCVYSITYMLPHHRKKLFSCFRRFTVISDALAGGFSSVTLEVLDDK